MPPPIPLLAQFYIKLGGTPAPDELLPDLRNVEVDANLFLPAMCTIEIHDHGFKWMDDKRLRLGQDIEIEARTSENEQGSPAKLFAGQVAAVEADMREEGVAFLIVRCYDRSHLLQRGTRVRSFVQATDSDIATTIAREHGLQVQVDATSQVHPHLFQDNVTDYDFLQERARAVGHVVVVADRTLNFKNPSNLGRQAVELDYGSSLLEFRPRLSVAQQVKDVSVRGWDPQNKRAFVALASSSEFQAVRTQNGKRASAMVQPAFGVEPGQRLVTDKPVASQAETDAFAKAMLAETWARDIRADGLAHGNPSIQPGAKVNVKGIGDAFSGEYFVTAARHTFGQEGHYLTHLTVSGLGAETAADLILEGVLPVRSGGRRPMPGLSVGIVTNNNDPENLGRIKVKFPWLADEAESYWARLVSPMAGNDRGFLYIPEVNDEVVVAFEHGDINHPYIVGALWNGTDAPPLKASDAVGGDGAVNKRIIKTRAGHKLTFDDTTGSERIEIIDAAGNKLVIDSQPGKLTIEMNGDIELKAKNNVTISGTSISLEGRAKVEVKAPQVEVTGSGRTAIKGGIVEIN